MSEKYEPELGQAVHGAPWSEVAAPEWIVALLERLADEIWRVTWNNSQEQGLKPTSNEGSEFVTDVFEMRSYYWGDCECGWTDTEYAGEHDADCYQAELRERMSAYDKESGYAALDEAAFGDGHDLLAGFDMEYSSPMLGMISMIGLPRKDQAMKDWRKASTERREFEDNLHEALTAKYGLPRTGCAVHCTCTYKRRFNEWWEANKKGPRGHAVYCGVEKPNFKCGDFEVRWYKHARRGTSMNRDIDPREATAIFDKCYASVQAQEKPLHD